jgi:hypothetical protein
MIFKLSDLRKTFLYFVQGPKFYGGGAPPSQSTSVTQATIPDELKPYISTYMGAAEKQLYQKNAEGEVSGFQPYKAYGGTYDATGNQLSYDPSKGIAGFSAMQQQAQTGAAGMKNSANFGTASTLAGSSGTGSLNAGQNYQNQMTDPNSVQAYMSPYMQNVTNQQIAAANRQYDISGAQQMGNATQQKAFGGSREALMAAENERGRNTAIGNIQATGLQSAFTNAQQQQQNVAQLGLQGMSQASQAASTLGNLGAQDLAAQQGILTMQNTMGAQQTAKDQAAKDQAMLDYANAQNKPMQDIGTMSSLVRGISTTPSSATTYSAQPSVMSQIGGLAATGIGAYGALKANGGVIEDKGYADGGIVGYKLGGDVEESMRNKLEDLDNPRLQEIIKENESPEMTKIAKEVMRSNYAKGGIVAFAGKKTENVVEDDAAVGRKTQAQLQAEQKLAVSKGASQGLGAIETPALITPKEAATLGPMSSEMPLKQVAQNQAEGTAMPGVGKIGAPLNPSANDPMAQLQASREAAAQDAAIPLDTRIQQQKDLEEKFVGKDTETAAYRKSIMDERANAPDEARRQMSMRLMEFGANWASTPGAPLVAGMKAITATLPGLMEDTKANKKMMKDLDKSEYLLNHAVRLEELGRMDKAAAYKEKASELFLKYDDKVVDAALKKQQLEQQKEISEAELANRITTTRMTNDASIRAHQITAAAGGKGDKSATENARIVARQNALKQAVTDAADEDKFTDADGKEISKSAWTKNRTVELEDYFLNVQPAAKQPKTEPTVVPLPSVGTIKDGYKYLGGDINKESSWSKI